MANRGLTPKQLLRLFELVIIDVQVVNKVKELADLPTKMLSDHHLKSYILHGIDMVGHQHIIGTLGQGCIQIDVPIDTTHIKHGLKGTRQEPFTLLKGLVVPERNDIASVPGIGFQLFENFVDDVVLFNDSTITLSNCYDDVALNEFDRLSKINGDILRHMIVKVDA